MMDRSQFIASLQARLPSARRSEPAAAGRIAVTGADGRTVERDLPYGETVLGAGLNADIIVPELPAAEALLLRAERALTSTRFTLVAVAPGIMLRDRELPVGVPTPGGDRLRLDIGRVAVLVTPRAAPVARAPRGSSRLALPLLLLALAAGALAMGGWRGSKVIVSSLDPAAGLNLPTSAPDRAIRDLNRQLKGGWLESSGKAQPGPDGVLLRGNILPQEADRLREVVDNVARRNDVKIITDLTVQGGPGSAQVAAVLLTPRRAVVGIDRRRYGVGDRMADGTEIKAIGEDSVTLLHNGLEEVLRF
jgi:hypothetical protein